jgi:hypothetical protein
MENQTPKYLVFILFHPGRKIRTRAEPKILLTFVIEDLSEKINAIFKRTTLWPMDQVPWCEGD